MKKLFLLLFLLVAAHCGYSQQINLTPVPASMTVAEGELVLPSAWSISTTNLDEASSAIVARFAASLSQSCNMKVTVNGNEPTLMVVASNSHTEAMGAEAYRLNITTSGIRVEAEAEGGFFYALQSIKKLLPPHVAVERTTTETVDYRLPCVNIDDRPRFPYRGYMLDVSRHFFTVNEVKRLLDIMAVYKLNKFHWHLTDDQGWRVEIKRYPKLTTVGAVRKSSYNTDYPGTGKGYTTNEPYGPYFYTQDEIRDVVRYAAERHIDVIPEVDMPGHFVAAMAAYPEYSCNPNVTREVWTNGGISTGILNVANPEAVNFVKNILDEICDLFPYPYVHIGGDECPTTEWEQNEACRQLMADLGYGTNFRRLQSHFTKEIADYLKTKGRKLYVWNETVTANGSDLEQVASTDATVMCWIGAENAAKAAANIGLKNVLTPQPVYYINRKQSTDANEPSAAGSGTDNLQYVYNYVPASGVDATTLDRYYTGVQGTFWTEHVNTPEYVEYLTLPRLIAIAETGWSPQSAKNFQNFVERIKQDTLMLNAAGYDYGRHYLRNTAPTAAVYPKTLNNGSNHWYRLATLNTSDANRRGKVIELLADGDAQVGNAGARAGMLWSASPSEAGSADYDYQQWGLKEDPAHPGIYALVCKARPNGSVNPQASAANNTGRWTYDDNNVYYNFVLSDAAYQGTTGANRYYAIRSLKYTNLWMNMAAGGQNYAINLWGNPTDGNGGEWEFKPMFSAEADPQVVANEAQRWLEGAKTYAPEAAVKPIGSFAADKAEALRALLGSNDVEALQMAFNEFKASMQRPEQDMTIRFVNTTATSYQGNTLLVEDGKVQNDKLGRWQKNGWHVSQVNGETMQILNADNGQALSVVGGLLSLGATPTAFRATYQPSFADFSLTNDGTNVWIPISKDFFQNPGAVKLSPDAIRSLGNGWKMEQVMAVSYHCTADNGQELGTYKEYVPVGQEYTPQAPQIENFILTSTLNTDPITADAPKTFELTYKRASFNVVYQCVDTYKNIIRCDTVKVPVGESFTLNYPQLPYYNSPTANTEASGTITPTEDMVIELTYSTNGINGFEAVGAPVKEVEAGRQYLIYNNTSASGRNGFIYPNTSRQIMTLSGATSGQPAFVWTTASSNGKMTLRSGEDGYMPEIPHGSNTFVTTDPNAAGLFTFTLNSDGSTFSVRSSNGNYFNGNQGSFTGWDDAHPYLFYTFVPSIYFKVTCRWVNEKDAALQPATVTWVKAGDSFTAAVPEIEGYNHIGTAADETINVVDDNTEIIVRYKTISTGIKQTNQTTDSEAIYDLQGRKQTRVKHRNIYIKGHKKYVIGR